MPTALDIKQIVGLGGGVILDAASFSVLDFKQFAGLANNSKAQITIRNAAKKLSVLDMKQIAGLAPGHVVFELV